MALVNRDSRPWVGTHTNAVRAAASLDPIVQNVKADVNAHTIGVESRLSGVEQSSAALARRLEAASQAHGVTVDQTAHVATEVSRLYEVTAQSLRETKRLHDQSLRRREARTTVELQLQSAHRDLLAVQRKLPALQQKLGRNITKGEARDTLANIAQPAVASLQRDIQACGQRLQAISLPAASLGSEGSGAPGAGAGGGANAADSRPFDSPRTADSSLEDAMTRAWRNVVNQVGATVQNELSNVKRAEIQRSRSLRDSLQRCDALTTKVESKLSTSASDKGRNAADACQRLTQAVGDVEASHRDEHRERAAVLEVSRSVAAELKKLHRDRKDRSAGRLRERRKELAHVLRTAFGGSGGRAHARA